MAFTVLFQWDGKKHPHGVFAAAAARAVMPDKIAGSFVPPEPASGFAAPDNVLYH
jgi:hypothetical protein